MRTKKHNVFKMVITTFLVISFIVLAQNECSALINWDVKFAKDTGWDGGTSGTASGSSSSFSVNLKPAGTGGVWGCRVKSKKNFNSSFFKKYNKYKLSFKAKSSKVDKFIYVVFGAYDNLYYRGPSRWIKLPKGKSVSVEHYFNKGQLKGLYFGIGGDAGDRNDKDWPYDIDAEDRYKVFDTNFAKEYLGHKDLKTLDCGGDFTSTTTISISSLKYVGIEDETTTNKKKIVKKKNKKKLIIKSAKSKKKKSLTIRWKKERSVTGYQFHISTNKKFKKHVYKKKFKRKRTKVRLVGLKRRYVYFVRGRFYYKKAGKIKYGKWSKVKRVVIK